MAGGKNQTATEAGSSGVGVLKNSSSSELVLAGGKAPEWEEILLSHTIRAPIPD